jgi:hypothetical protein
VKSEAEDKQSGEEGVWWHYVSLSVGSGFSFHSKRRSADASMLHE